MSLSNTNPRKKTERQVLGVQFFSFMCIDLTSGNVVFFFVFSMFFWFLQPGTTLTAEKLQLLQQLQKNYRYYSNCRETTATGATAEKLQLLQLLQGNYSFYNYCRETAATTATAEELQLLQQLQRNYSYYSYCRETAATTATAEKLQLLHLFF